MIDIFDRTNWLFFIRLRTGVFEMATTTSRLSRLDQLYRTVFLTKFFPKGWGEPEKLQKCVEFRPNFLSRESCANLVPRNWPVILDKEYIVGKTRIIDGHFLSPLAHHLPDIVKPPIDRASFQLVLPLTWPHSTFPKFKPIVVQLAGTGDHYFRRRRYLMATPLVKESGVGSILLENPFYGHRRPKEQWRSSLCNVMDLFVMGGCLILECQVLLDWCDKQGYGPLALHGVSMGGHMASLAAGSYSKPVALIPCLSSAASASAAFTKGVLSNSVAWPSLEKQYAAYRGSNPLFEITERKRDQNTTVNCQSEQRLENQAIVQPDDKTVAIVASNGATVATNKLLGFLNAFVLPMLYLKDRQLKLGKGSENEEARAAVEEHMRCILDEFTHLANFPQPVDQELIIAVSANHDAYLPRDPKDSLATVWPQAEIRHVDRGHVAAFLLDQKLFRKAIVDALHRMATKYGE